MRVEDDNPPNPRPLMDRSVLDLKDKPDRPSYKSKFHLKIQKEKAEPRHLKKLLEQQEQVTKKINYGKFVKAEFFPTIN